MKPLIIFCILCALLLTYLNISAAIMLEADADPEPVHIEVPTVLAINYIESSVEPTPAPEEDEPEEWESLGMFLVSHYSPDPDENGGYTVTCTGDKLTDGIGLWCAANAKDIPFGSTIRIDGYGELIVNDTGVRQGVLDVLVADKKTAFDLGLVTAEVWVKRKYE